MNNSKDGYSLVAVSEGETAPDAILDTSKLRQIYKRPQLWVIGILVMALVGACRLMHARTEIAAVSTVHPVGFGASLVAPFLVTTATSAPEQSSLLPPPPTLLLLLGVMCTEHRSDRRAWLREHYLRHAAVGTQVRFFVDAHWLANQTTGRAEEELSDVVGVAHELEVSICTAHAAGPRRLSPRLSWHPHGSRPA